MKSADRLLKTILAVLIVSGTVSRSYGDENAGSPLIGWDTILDPDEDCEIKSIITIKVPGKVHDLNDTSRGQGLNAPRLLKHVSGDFTAQVKVNHDFDPTLHNGWFITAGMVIWEDETNFMRIERTGSMRNGELYCMYPPVEHWRNRNHVGIPPGSKPASEVFGIESAWLKVQRKDEKVKVWTSKDGKEWKLAIDRKNLFAEDVSIGLHVVTTCKQALTVTFEDFDIQFH